MKALPAVRYAAVALLACLAGALSISDRAGAQDWPSKNVTVVVPLGAGSASDIMARVVMDQVGRQLGHTFVIENRPGAGGSIGAGMVAKSAPDGHTILAYGALAIAHALHAKLPYDTLADFTPVIPFGQQPLVVVVPPSKGYKTLADLIAAAKKNPGAMNYSSAGVGSASHFAAERLRSSAGFTAQHIPFKGASEAVTEVMAGRADFSVQLFTTTLPLLREGKLAALAVNAQQRTAVMPELPTMIEAGLTAESIYPFYSAVYVPAKTPRNIVEKLYRETEPALQAPAVRERFATLGVEPMPMTQAEFAEFFRRDLEATVALAKTAGIQPQ